MEEIVFESTISPESSSAMEESSAPAPKFEATPTMVSLPPPAAEPLTLNSTIADTTDAKTDETSSTAVPTPTTASDKASQLPSTAASDSMDDLLQDDADMDAFLGTQTDGDDDAANDKDVDLNDLDGLDDDDDDLEDLEKFLSQSKT
jgi:hypothetical protein